MLVIYARYFWYILVHKYYVGVELAKLGLYRAMITHDLSKFSPAEFSAYAMKFKSSVNSKIIDDNFDRAWEHHKKWNRHHWQHWGGKPMPDRYVKEMIADWEAMGRVFGGCAFDYFVKNQYKMNLHPETVARVKHRIFG